MHARDVSDDAVWHAGNKTFADLARQFNCDKKSLHAELHRRGWRKAGKSGVTYQAPCAECGEPTQCGPADPGGLDGRRICRECRNPKPVEDEPEWKKWYRIERAKREHLIRALEEGTRPIEPYRRPQPSLRSLLRKAG